jgi:hypothetical protein
VYDVEDDLFVGPKSPTLDELLKLTEPTTTHEPSREALLLRYRFKKGQILTYKLNSQIAGSIYYKRFYNGNEERITKRLPTLKTQILYTTEIMEVVARTYTVCLKYQDFTMSSPQNPNLAPLNNKIFTNLKVIYQIDSCGNILRILQIEKDLQKIKELTKQGLLTQSFIKSLEKFVKAQIDEMAITFPERQVSLNETWTEKKTLSHPSMGIVNIYSKYTLSGIEAYQSDSCALIDFTFEVAAKDKDLLDRMFSNLPSQSKRFFKEQMEEISFALSGEGKGRVVFAYNQGRLLRIDLVGNLYCKTTMKPKTEISNQIKTDLILLDYKLKIKSNLSLVEEMH